MDNKEYNMCGDAVGRNVRQNLRKSAKATFAAMLRTRSKAKFAAMLWIRSKAKFAAMQRTSSKAKFKAMRWIRSKANFAAMQRIRSKAKFAAMMWIRSKEKSRRCSGQGVRQNFRRCWVILCVPWSAAEIGSPTELRSRVLLQRQGLSLACLVGLLLYNWFLFGRASRLLVVCGCLFLMKVHAIQGLGGPAAFRELVFFGQASPFTCWLCLPSFGEDGLFSEPVIGLLGRPAAFREVGFFCRASHLLVVSGCRVFVKVGFKVSRL